MKTRCFVIIIIIIIVCSQHYTGAKKKEEEIAIWCCFSLSRGPFSLFVSPAHSGRPEGSVRALIIMRTENKLTRELVSRARCIVAPVKFDSLKGLSLSVSFTSSRSRKARLFWKKLIVLWRAHKLKDSNTKLLLLLLFFSFSSSLAEQLLLLTILLVDFWYHALYQKRALVLYYSSFSFENVPMLPDSLSLLSSLFKWSFSTIPLLLYFERTLSSNQVCVVYKVMDIN